MNKEVGKAPKGVEGIITRGKTAPNRLRRVDIFLLLYATELFSKQTPDNHKSFYIDLGYGAEAFTVLESAYHFRKTYPTLPILGVEIDPTRVERAKPFEDQWTEFRLGGFNLPLKPNESARIIRAFNVFRQYEETDVLPNWFHLSEYLLPEGLLIEGTSDPYGKIWTANLIRKSAAGLIHEGLLFSTNFRFGFRPDLFPPYLPKNLIHHMHSGETIFQFFEDWRRATQETIAFQPLGLRQWFSNSAHRLADFGYSLVLTKRFLNKGYLLWRWNQPIQVDKASK